MRLFNFPRKKETVVTAVDVDGNEYPTVRIGDQLWLKENLKTKRFRDGSPIPFVSDKKRWEETKTPAYCFYDNCGMLRAKYGLLYNWYAVETGQLAMKGWHVPSHAEWNELNEYLSKTDRPDLIAKSLAEKYDWTPNGVRNAAGNDLSLNNSTGFSALPSGYCGSNGNFSGSGENGYDACWWSADETGGSDAILRWLYFDGSSLHRENMDKRSGCAIRLLKDR